jgi:GntR family transcriptional regulator
MVKSTAYRKAASVLRQRILSGQIAPGSRLPAERELCGLLKVSRITVRQALDILAEERLIVRRPGSGTYASDRPQRVVPLGVDYAGSLSEHAPQATRRLVRLEETNSAPAWAVAQFPAVADGFVIAERLDCADGRPIARDQAVMPRALAAGLGKRDFAAMDFLERWIQRQGLRIETIDQTISSIRASARDSRLLEVAPGSPILRALESYRSSTGEVLATFLSHYHPARVEIHSCYHWRSQPGGGGVLGRRGSL